MHIRLTREGRTVRNKFLVVAGWIVGSLLVIHGCASAFDSEPSPRWQTPVSVAVAAPQPAAYMAQPMPTPAIQPQSVFQIGSAPQPPPAPQPLPVPAVTGYIKITPAFAQIGEPVKISVFASGGDSGYTYSWSGTDGLAGDTATVQWNYQNPGLKYVSVIVRSAGNWTKLRWSLEVLRPDPLAPPPRVSGGQLGYPQRPAPAVFGGDDEPVTVAAPTWAAQTLTATTPWERSYGDAKAAAWTALRGRVLQLPMRDGKTISDLTRLNPPLYATISQTIAAKGHVVEAHYLPNGRVSIEITMSLREIARIVQTQK
jgi:hypothetical protein